MTTTEGTPDEPAPKRAIRLARQGARLREQQEVWQRERLEVVAELTREGWSQTDIADLFGMAKQRAGQLVAEAREAGLLEPGRPLTASRAS